MKTLQECADYLEQVGMATVLPGKSGHFPCLLWQARGRQGPIEEADEAFHKVWAWKDQLPAQRVAYAGRLLGGQVLLIHKRLLPALLACQQPIEPENWYRSGQMTRDAYQIWQKLRDAETPLGRSQLRINKSFDRAARELEARLVISRAGSESKASGWDANAYDLVARLFPNEFEQSNRLTLAEARRRVEAALPQSASLAQRRRWMIKLNP